MEDIEDLVADLDSGFDLKTGERVDPERLEGIQRSKSDCGIIEVSRREDAATALSVLWKSLLLRKPRNIRYNNLIGRPYNLDLSDPNWRVLVLWTKDPGKVADFLVKGDPDTGITLLDAWPVVYVIVTLNGYHPELEPRVAVSSLKENLDNLERLGAILADKYGGEIEPRHCIYAKIADPFVRYRLPNSEDPTGVRGNWGDLEEVYERLHIMGIREAHYGPLDLRGKWIRAVDMAKEDGVELLPFDWTARVGSAKDDISPAVKEMLLMADKHEVRLVTCGDVDRIGMKATREDGTSTKSVRTGICLALSRINRLLRAVGEQGLKKMDLKKPKGQRTCGCQDAADIGMSAHRYAPEGSREACHGCSYCFVRCKWASASSKKQKKNSSPAKRRTANYNKGRDSKRIRTH